MINTFVFFGGLPGFLVLLRLPVHSSFSGMYQIVVLSTPKDSAISLKGQICFFQRNDGLLHLHPHHFGLHLEISHEHLPNASSTLGINPRPLSS